MRAWMEDFCDGARHNFWQGYQLGLETPYIPELNDSENIWHGWSMGRIEREGWLRLSNWQARLQRTRQFTGVLWKLIRSFRRGLEFGSREKDGTLTISVSLGKWN